MLDFERLSVALALTDVCMQVADLPGSLYDGLDWSMDLSRMHCTASRIHCNRECNATCDKGV